MKKYALSFFLVFSLLFILCPIQNVSASDASTLELGDDIVATSSYRVKSKTKKADTYGSWTTVASNITGASKNGEVLGAVVDMGWSNSITGGISLSYTSKKGLTASMGFDVTKSGSVKVGSQYTIPLNKGQKGYIKARPIYTTYSCKLQRFYRGSNISAWQNVAGTFTSKKFSGGADFTSKVWY